MKSSIAKLTLVLAFVLATTYAVLSQAGAAPSEAFGFSSEDFLGGGSYLGVDTRDISNDRMAELHLKEESGVEVTLVDQDAPAGAAGVKEHDVILTINGNKVESVEQLRRMIREIPSGRTVAIGISRQGQPMTLKAQLADRKRAFLKGRNAKGFYFEAPVIPAIPAIPAVPEMPEFDVPVSVVVVHSSVRSGLMVENLTPQLGDFLGAKNGQGVLVRSVEKGSRADKAGFHAGDVIVKVNGEAINDSGDFSHALRERSKDSVTVNLIRDKKEQTLTLTLPERKQGRLEDRMGPEVNAGQIDLSDLTAEVAKVKPQLELAVRQMESVRPVIAKVRVQLNQQLNQIRKQVEKVRIQMRPEADI